MQSAFTWLKGDMVMWRVWLLEAWSSGAVGVVAGVGVGGVHGSHFVAASQDPCWEGLFSHPFLALHL